MLELPKYKGIEEAMQDVKVVARDKGIERCVGLLPCGARFFDVLGDDEKVEMPHGKTGHDVFIIHGHPGMPCELSDMDLFCICGIDAKGNMAVSGVDDTVSWTTGIDVDRDDLNSGIWQFMVKMYADRTKAHCLRRIDPDYEKSEWSPNDDRYVVMAHLMNKKFTENRFLKDYHLQVGAVEQAILDKWLPKLGEKA